MGAGAMNLPPGFVLDQPAAPALPAGFVLDDAQGGSVAARFDAVNDGARPEMAAPMQHAAQEKTRGPQVDPGASVAIEFLNQGSAASQRTTPNINAQGKNLISADVYENDAGEVMFKDPATGQVIPTDRNKHVVLRDPTDNTPKVYARTADTNEGVLSAAGRLLGTGLATGAPTLRPGVGLRPAIREGQRVADAASRVGVEIPRAVSTDSTAVQRTASSLRNIPLAGDALVNASQKAIEQTGEAAANVAKGYGGGTIAGSGDAARGAIRQYITGTTAARSKKLYDAVDNLVDDGVKMPLELTRGVTAEILARRGNAALGENSKAINLVLEAIERPSGLNYSGVKDLRTAVGEMVESGILPEGMSGKELKQIYSALSDDLKLVVNRAGGERASAAFERANNYYRLISGRRETLAKIIGATGDAPAERVFDRLVSMASSTARADVETLVKARKAIGAEDWNEFTSGLISQMGRSPALRGAPEALQGTDFSPERFLTAYNKLSNAGRELLFRSGGKGELANALKDIATVSSRFRELQKFSNPSGTAQNLMGGALGGSIVGPLAMGDVVTPLGVIGSVIGGKALASVLARPAAAASVADWARKYERAVRVPKVPQVALLTTASKNLANTLKDVGVTLNPSDILRAIQSPMKSAADEEQPAVPRRPGE